MVASGESGERFDFEKYWKKQPFFLSPNLGPFFATYQHKKNFLVGKWIILDAAPIIERIREM